MGRTTPSLSSRQLGAAQFPDCSAGALLRMSLLRPHQLWAVAGNLAESLCSSTDALTRSHTSDVGLCPSEPAPSGAARLQRR